MSPTNFKPDWREVGHLWKKIGYATYGGVHVTIYSDENNSLRYLDDAGYEFDMLEVPSGSAN
jgi:hypothetical protein